MTSTDRWRVPVVAVWLALGLLAASTSVAVGHAELASSNPEANAILERSPDAVVLRFRQPIDPETALLRVLDDHGAVMTAAGTLQARVDGLELRIGVPPLEPGQYTTEYRVTSALDGHSMAGRLAFLIDPTGTLTLSVPRTDLPVAQHDAAAVVARWLGVAPLLAAGGTIVLWLTAVLPLAGAAGSRERPVSRSFALPWVTVAAFGAVSFLGTALYLALLSASIAAPAGQAAGLPLDFAAPFGSTPFAWAMRATLGAGVGIFVLGGARAVVLDEGRRRGRASGGGLATDRRLGVAVAVLAAAGLAGVAASAHASSAGGPLTGGVAWLHLAAAGVSLGAVPGALILAGRERQPPEVSRSGTPPPGGAIRATAGRYAPLAVGAIVVVALTGLVNSPLVSGLPRELVASAYGNLLIAKAVLLATATAVVVMTALALRRRKGVRRWLVGGQLVAAAIGVAALAASSALATTEPASHRRGVVGGPPSSALHLYGESDGVQVHAVVNAPAPGEQQYQAVVTGSDGVPLEADRVVMRFRPPDASSLNPSEVQLIPQQSPGTWGTRGALTSEPGEWNLDVLVTSPGEPQLSVSFSVPVTEPLPAELVPEPADGVTVPAPLAVVWEVLPPGPAMWLPAGVALATIAALLVAARRRAWPPGAGARRWTAARVGLSVVAVVLGIAAGSQALVDAASAPPPAAAARLNPVEATTDSIERGARLYTANCAACHGADGNGGPLAEGMLPAPEPLDQTVSETTPGGLAYLIAAGKAGTPMPGFVATLSTRDRWDLVNYLRDRFGASP